MSVGWRRDGVLSRVIFIYGHVYGRDVVAGQRLPLHVDGLKVQVLLLSYKAVHRLRLSKSTEEQDRHLYPYCYTTSSTAHTISSVDITATAVGCISAMKQLMLSLL